MGCLYFNVSEGVRWAKSSKKREDFPCPAGQATRLPCGERTCPEHVLQSEVDNLCPPLCQAGGRDARKGRGEGVKSCPFLAAGCPGTPHPNGRLSHSKCCGFRRNCEFFHKNRPDLLGEK